MSDLIRKRVRGTLLLLFVGLPSFVTCVGGGIVLLAGVTVGIDPLGMVQAAIMCLGGFAGLWGSRTLSSEPEQRSVRPTIAAVVGVVTFGLFFILSR